MRGMAYKPKIWYFNAKASRFAIDTYKLEPFIDGNSYLRFSIHSNLIKSNDTALKMKIGRGHTYYTYTVAHKTKHTLENVIFTYCILKINSQDYSILTNDILQKPA